MNQKEAFCMGVRHALGLIKQCKTLNLPVERGIEILEKNYLEQAEEIFS